MSTTVSDVARVPNLRRYRLWRAYSQADLARESGVSERTIRGAEADGSVSLRTLRKLAKVLDVEPNDLTGQEWGQPDD